MTGANVDFTFALPKARGARGLHDIKVQLAYTPNVLSPRSDHRPTTWDRHKNNPDWAPGKKVNLVGAYVRPWLENSILPNEQSFSLRVHVKNRAEAGGEVGNGWIAMRVETRNDISLVPGAEWACMPVGGGTCPAAWPGRPTASVTALDSGSVMSGNDARFEVSVNPAPAAGETRRVYLKTWEVFVNARDTSCPMSNWIPPGDGKVYYQSLDFPRPFFDAAKHVMFDPQIHCDPPLRKGNYALEDTQDLWCARTA